MSMDRKAAAFGDLRGWIKALEAAGELHDIGAEVDWNIELGTIMRLAQGAGTGPALLFHNIKDYNHPESRCRRVFGCGLSSYRRVAMMLGLPPDTHPRELVKMGRSLLNGSIPAGTSISISSRCRTGTGRTAAATSSPMGAW
jgi:3-polyprenyl-4-hydroxybenzoate decarboxylase